MINPICFAIFFPLLTFPLSPLWTHTPRLLITMGESCDFSALELAQKTHARVLKGSEKEMANQICEEDLLDLTHLIILDAPVQDLSEFASRVFYDYIHLNSPWDKALIFLEKKFLWFR